MLTMTDNAVLVIRDLANQQDVAEDGGVRIAADPDDREALREQAHLTRVIGRIPDAVRQLDALIAEDPDDGEALFERGLIEQRAGDLRRAQRWFERAVNAGAVSDARLHLAEVLYQRGQNEHWSCSTNCSRTHRDMPTHICCAGSCWAIWDITSARCKPHGGLRSSTRHWRPCRVISPSTVGLRPC